MIEMPHLITLDFETFYDTKFSLSRLTTEEYIRSPDFEVIGVGIKICGCYLGLKSPNAIGPGVEKSSAGSDTVYGEGFVTK